MLARTMDNVINDGRLIYMAMGKKNSNDDCKQVLTVGESLGAVPEAVADDDEGRLVGLVGRADGDGAVAGPFDEGRGH